VASIILLLGPSNNLLSSLLSCVRDTRLFSARGKIDECDGIRNEPPPRDNLGEKNIADHSRPPLYSIARPFRCKHRIIERFKNLDADLNFERVPRDERADFCIRKRAGEGHRRLILSARCYAATSERASFRSPQFRP